MTLEILRVEPAETEAEPEVVAEPRKRAGWPVLLLLVLAQAVIALDVALPVLRPVLALVTFVGLPTLVLHCRARFAADSAVARLLYALGVTVLGLILGGLLLDTLLPRVGVDRPLAPAPLAIACLLVDLALLRWRSTVPLVTPGAARTAYHRAVEARFESAPTLAVLGLLLAVLGAVVLLYGA